MIHLSPFSRINVCFVSIVLSCLASFAQSEQMILFSSSRRGNSDIFIMQSDGSNQRGLVTTIYEEWAPTWKSKNEITFLRQLDDAIVRVGLNLDTMEEMSLAQPNHCILDDKNMLYAPSQKSLYSCQDDIFVKTKEADIINLTQDLDAKARYPSWTNTAQQLIFTSNHKGTNDIYSYDLLTQEIVPLTDSRANNERGELSPDGKYLVFSTDSFETGHQEIGLLALETQTLINVSNSGGTALIARFSKDGTTIFYGSNHDGNWEIYSYNIALKQTKRLTYNETFDGDPRVYHY